MTIKTDLMWFIPCNESVNEVVFHMPTDCTITVINLYVVI